LNGWLRSLCLLFGLALGVWGCAPTAPAAEQPGYYDDHDSADPVWRDGGGDATHRVEGPSRAPDRSRGGARTEAVRVTSGVGAAAYLAHDIPAMFVIPEWKASIWVKSDRPGVQVLARIVLPRAADPRTGQPLTTLVRGSATSLANSWQQLRLDDLMRQFENQIRAMRVELRTDISTQEAYVDQILLNTYTGQGAVNLWIDDLEIYGVALRKSDNTTRSPQRLTANPIAPTLAKPPEVRLSGALLTIDGKPFFPRGIQYQGEPLTHLQRLGFNTLFLSSPPSLEMCSEAAALNLWLVAPPPVKLASRAGEAPTVASNFGPEYDHVLAWDLGQGLSGSDLETLIQVAKQLRAADTRMKRLVICGAEADLRSFSRHVDVLVTHRQPLGTSLELNDYAIWLRERPRLARPGTITWTMIQTQLSPKLQEQQTLLSRGKSMRGVADDESIRLLTRAALAAGVRGICFQSNARLDGADAETRMRALALALINLELDLMEPWAASGTYSTAATTNKPEIGGAILQTDRAKLLLPMRLASGAQCSPKPANLTGLTFIVPGVSEAHEAFELTPVGLQRLKHKRVTGGISVTLGEAGLSSLVVLTQDPVVVNSLTKRTAALAKAAAEWQRDLAAGNLALVESLDARLAAQGKSVKESQAWLTAAKTDLQQAGNAVGAGNAALGYAKSLSAATSAANLKRAHWEKAAATAGLVSSSPLAAGFMSLPQHWELLEEVRLSRPGDNRLRGGDFEDLNTLVQSGWQHFQYAQPEVKTEVDLAPQGASQGRLGLHLKAAPANPKEPPTLIESAPVWITSGPVPVEPGTTWVITGKVKVLSSITGSVDGLMIIDSIGGEPLAERIGDTKGWKEFMLYRAAPANGSLTLTFALTGLGEAYLDDVQVRPLQRGTTLSPPANSQPPLVYGLPPSTR